MTDPVLFVITWVLSAVSISNSPADHDPACPRGTPPALSYPALSGAWPPSLRAGSTQVFARAAARRWHERG
jgi:hypothetical protein